MRKFMRSWCGGRGAFGNRSYQCPSSRSAMRMAYN
jgi:hypothetical protein